jgi:hypothetical protein
MLRFAIFPGIFPGALVFSLHVPPRFKFITVHAAVACALALTLPSSPAAQDADPAASLLMARARQSHFAGDYSAAVICVRASYLGGRDTLRGVLEVRESSGERRLALRGAGGSFEWWSRLGGREQWRREGAQGRLRRLPPYAHKKPAFAPDVSYEDLMRLPFGHLEGSRSARRGLDSDSLVVVELTPDARLAGQYSSLIAAFGRDPLVLRRLAFVGNGVRPSKTMEFRSYLSEPGGLFPAEIVFSGADGLSSVKLLLTPLRVDLARDKAFMTETPEQGFAEPRWLPRDEPPETR